MDNMELNELLSEAKKGNTEAKNNIYEVFETELMQTMKKAMPVIYKEDVAKATLVALDHLIKNAQVDTNDPEVNKSYDFQDVINRQLNVLAVNFTMTIIKYRYFPKEQLQHRADTGDELAKYVLERGAVHKVEPKDDEAPKAANPKPHGILDRFREKTKHIVQEMSDPRLDCPREKLTLGSNLFKDKR